MRKTDILSQPSSCRKKNKQIKQKLREPVVNLVYKNTIFFDAAISQNAGKVMRKIQEQKHISIRRATQFQLVA